MPKKKILFINPNKWGRGITTIWIASHAGVLKKNDVEVDLFDATFYESWSDLEIDLNTKNLQFQSTNYKKKINYNQNDIFIDLQKRIDTFKPDIIFFSAISSHIHGEGEYISVDYSYELLNKIKYNSLVVCGGIKATNNSIKLLKKFEKIDFVISGESELVLIELINKYPNIEEIKKLEGLTYVDKENYIKNKPQKIMANLDQISPYDYDLFDEQTFLRPYNGKVVKAVDFEISRGCIYSCSYCVETILQKYYGFNEINQKSGSIKNFNGYLRSKSAKMIFREIQDLNKNYGITLFRLQDTNFLTIDRSVLIELSDLMEQSKIDIMLYIETRAEGINEKSIELLKKLRVDGVGMGLELSDESYRAKNLNRFINQEKIIKAFKMLKAANINRTSYNIIGLPNQTEQSIIKTIEFNYEIKPDTCIAAYYSIYEGTALESAAKEEFDKNDLYGMDPQIRSKISNHKLSEKILNFYKNYFSYFVKNGLNDLEEKKNLYL